MDITLYSFSKRANSTKRPSGGVTVSGYLREGADLRSPSFILKIPPDQLSTYMSYNYAQVLGQYYYVGDMINRSATEWELPMTLDELATFKNEILNTTAFVLYSTSDFDKMINDTRLDVRPVRRIYKYLDRPSSTFDVGNMYVLVIYDNNGITPGSAFLLSETQMSKVIENLNNPSIMGAIAEFIHGSALDAFIGCRCYNVNVASFSKVSSASDIYMAGTNVGQGMPVSMTLETPSSGVVSRITGEFDLSSIGIDDFRAIYEREYLISVPFCGTYHLDPMLVQNHRYIQYMMSMDVISGEVAVTILASNTSKASGSISKASTVLQRVGGKCGRDVPLGKDQMNRGLVVTGLASVAGVASGNPLLASGVASVIGGNITQTIVNGGIGGSCASNMQMDNYFILDVMQKQTEFEPEAIAPIQGRPCYNIKRIGDLSGYVQTSGASVSAAAPKDILSTLNSALDAGIYVE